MNLKKLLAGISLVAATFTLTGFDDVPMNYKMATEVYEVKPGDTLWSISTEYINKNTYGQRDVREFISGIVELNYDQVFNVRTPGEIYPGDELRINYWIKQDVPE